VEHSEQMNEIAAALAKAQGAIRGAAKDSTNPHFKNRYADLASVWDACRAQLAANGIAVVQAPRSEGPTVTVETLLAHASGQWFKDSLATVAADARAQSIGSAITYLRRYALAAMVGVAPDDDDGEAAEGREAPSAGSRAAPRNEAPKQTPPPPKTNGVPPPHVAALWQRVREAKGEGKASSTPKTRAAFEQAGRTVWGDHPKPSTEWTVEDVAKVSAEIFGPDDVPF
jgi:hypothetical protein